MTVSRAYRYVPVLIVVPFLSGCPGILTNDQCCCEKKNGQYRFIDCNDKTAQQQCEVVVSPGDAAGSQTAKDFYNQCQKSSQLLDPMQSDTATIVLARYTVGDDSPPKTILIPGVNYAKSISKIRTQLLAAYVNSASVPVSSILEQLPLNTADIATFKLLEGRGAIKFNDQSASNTGKYLEAKINDERVGSIQLVVPEALSATVSRSADSLKFTFPEPPTVILQGVATKYEIPSNQRLETIEIRSDAVEYDFHSSGDSSEKMKLTVVLSKASSTARLLPEACGVQANP